MKPITEKSVRGIDLTLTDEQKAAIQKFWADTGSVGRLELKVDVVGDRISPASIQVGTAK